MIRYKKNYFVVCLLLVSVLAYGQQNPTPSERTITIDEPVIFKDSLPKISLPDFVITGQEKINVEGSKKLELEESRIFLLTGEPPAFFSKDVALKSADIPLKKLSGLEMISTFNGFVKAQIGNFTSPNISGGLGYSYAGYFAALYGSYLSRKEHEIKNSDFSTGNIGVTLGTVIPKTNNIFSDATVKINMGYDARNYNNYWSILEHYNPEYYNDRRLPRHYNSFFINSSIASDKEEYFKYRVNIYFNTYENDFDFKSEEPIPDISFKQGIEETKFALLAGGDYRYLGMDFTGDMLLYYTACYFNIPWGLLYEPYPMYPDEGLQKNLLTFGLFGSGSINITDNFFLTAGLKFYLYDYLYSMSKGDEDIVISKGTILPQLSLRYENRNDFSLSVVFNPDLKIMDFERLCKLNPFTLYDEINHSLTPINLFLHFDVSAIKNLRILADVGYLEEKNTPYFYTYDYGSPIHGTTQIYYKDYFSYFHDNATTKGVYWNLKMEYKIDESNMVSLGFNYQNKKIDSLRVPFVPRVRASISYEYLYDKFTINPIIEFMGDRVSPVRKGLFDYSINSFMEDKQDAVVLLNLDVEYLIIENLTANLSITNMFNSKYCYYAGYQEYPFSIFVGLKFKW